MSKSPDTDAPLLSSKATPRDTQPQSPNESPKEKTLEYQEIGVWTTMREARASWRVPGSSAIARGKEVVGILPFVYRFFKDCFSVGPSLLTAYFLASLWTSTSAVGLYFSSRILDLIQRSTLERQVDRPALASAVMFRNGLTLGSSVIGWFRRKARSILTNRVRYLFEGRLLQANLRLDLPTFEEPETGSKINRLVSTHDKGGAWKIFNDLLDKFTVVASVTSQIGFVFKVLRSQPGSMWFVALCLSKSVLEYTLHESWWSTPSYTWDSNVHYRRLSSLLRVAFDGEHRSEVVSNGLAGYIQREWSKAREFLRDVSDDRPWSVIRTRRSLPLIFLDNIADDFPLIFYAYQVALWPGSCSLTSVALTQQAARSLGWTISSILDDPDTIAEYFDYNKALYETSHIPNNLQDGELRYPQDSNGGPSGMEISFKNVSFAYPNAENVIKDVSFTVRRGQTVIIVGVNGSGKSTLLKLFNRLYDPTTVRENIAMGLPDKELLSTQGEKTVEHLDPIVEAARLGSADEFIRAQKNGFDTVLKPFLSAWSSSSGGRMSHVFKKRMKEINKSTDVSHGQWQRLALSRLFFRAAGSDIKLVAVDEPSASLDPDMEYELFESLKNLSTKKGKTMVFVTHRFGHLTKQADLILVMKNGCLVEQGKHDDLLEMEGEYAKLFKLQANAFFPPASTNVHL